MGLTAVPTITGMSYQALLFCPDDKTARVVTQVLTELDFTVEPCNEPFAAVKKLMAQHFDAIVVDCDNEQNAALLFKSARNSGSNQSSLAVAVVEGQAGVAKAFRIGANLVLTKPINVEQSKGTLRVARGLLRKADSGKPAGTPGAEAKAPVSPVFEPSHAPAPAPAPMKPLVAAFTTPNPPAAPPAPVASSETGFEREADHGPRPEPTEAALLESMSDVLPEAKTVSTTPKEYPWQPVSKLAEPMASALRVAAEAAAKPSTASVETATPDWGSPKEAATETRSLTSSSASSSQSGSQGAATAPAPAKHDLKISAQTIKFEDSAAATPVEDKPAEAIEIPTKAPRLEPPTFAALAVKDHEEESDEPQEGGKKAYVIIALVVLAAIFTAYTVYLKTHDSTAPSVAPATPQQMSQAPQAQTSTKPSPASVPANAEPAPQEIVLATPKAAQPQSKKPVDDVTVIKFPDAKSATQPASPTIADQGQAPEPVVVKHDAPAPGPKAAEPDVAPPALIGPADDKALANIAAVSATAVAKPVASTLKVSQGVSQGLLVKRVQPIYPSQALQMRIEGTVLLQANIAKDGKISSVKVLKGDNVLAKAAVDAVKQWTYNPYLLNGEPVEIQTQMTITFKLP